MTYLCDVNKTLIKYFSIINIIISIIYKYIYITFYFLNSKFFFIGDANITVSDILTAIDTSIINSSSINLLFI